MQNGPDSGVNIPGCPLQRTALKIDDDMGWIVWFFWVVKIGLDGLNYSRLYMKWRTIKWLPCILIFCYEWGDSAMIYTNDEVTNENHCRIVSKVTKNRYSRVNHTQSHFLHATLCPHRAHKNVKANHRMPISSFPPRTVFSELSFWRHHGSTCDVMRTRGTGIVTSNLSVVLARANWRKCDFLLVSNNCE